MYGIIGTEQQFISCYNQLKEAVPEVVIKKLHKKIKILDEAYGTNRDIEKSLGGYCVVISNADEWAIQYQKLLDKYNIDKEQYEYRDEIKTEEITWLEELYILSSDYGIVLFYPKGKEE